MKDDRRVRAKRELFELSDTTTAGRLVWVVGAFSLIYLAGMIGADFAVPAHQVLIDYFAAAPLIAAAALGWRSTLAVGLAAVVAGLVAGAVHDGGLGSSATALQIGSVAVAAVASGSVAASRERRQRRLEGITEVAEAAEHAIVRAAPIALPDVEVATVYRSAATLASIGGDLYEGVSTPYGSRLIIGDAKGKGLPAVQLAAVVLGAFRHASLSEPDLGRLVADLDRTVAAFAKEEDFVTALIIEVAEIEVRLVCCGHPAPLIGPPGYVRQIELESGLPLGMGGCPKVEVRGFPTRQLLLAYTDGLVEARSSEGDMLAIDSVASAIDTWEPADALELVERMVSEHVAGEIRDDVTILTMTRNSVQPVAGGRRRG